MPQLPHRSPRMTEKEREYIRLLEEQAASGLKLSEFARERGLKESRIRWWKAEIRRRSRRRRAKPSESPGEESGEQRHAH